MAGAASAVRAAADVRPHVTGSQDSKPRDARAGGSLPKPRIHLIVNTNTLPYTLNVSFFAKKTPYHVHQHFEPEELTRELRFDLARHLDEVVVDIYFGPEGLRGKKHCCATLVGPLFPKCTWIQAEDRAVQYATRSNSTVGRIEGQDNRAEDGSLIDPDNLGIPAPAAPVSLGAGANVSKVAHVGASVVAAASGGSRPRAASVGGNQAPTIPPPMSRAGSQRHIPPPPAIPSLNGGPPPVAATPTNKRGVPTTAAGTGPGPASQASKRSDRRGSAPYQLGSPLSPIAESPGDAGTPPRSALASGKNGAPLPAVGAAPAPGPALAPVAAVAYKIVSDGGHLSPLSPKSPGVPEVPYFHLIAGEGSGKLLRLDGKNARDCFGYNGLNNFSVVNIRGENAVLKIREKVLAALNGAKDTGLTVEYV